MKSSNSVLDPQLAWALWHGLTKLSLLLWDCYEKDFLKLAKEERDRRGTDSEEDREIETPF
jgi:hypothetical protein